MSPVTNCEAFQEQQKPSRDTKNAISLFSHLKGGEERKKINKKIIRWRGEEPAAALKARLVLNDGRGDSGDKGDNQSLLPPQNPSLLLLTSHPTPKNCPEEAARSKI